ncbi:winged helix-turn-helix domain-containing protein [Rhizobium cauense]|uniref:winged helix-turn-helix transcriptional regulator n=1 Tax=Rhizobium cauense TaxID=1166683 RepID=UPI001C6E7E2B|nr:response regulator transcription factor [Rhizobium cauense]MBW9117977.1 winged helix-turn-helix domain-containing protein [Rhizobium cauense]
MRPTIVIGSRDVDLCFIARHVLEQSGFAASLQGRSADIIAATGNDNVCALLIDGRVRNAIAVCQRVHELVGTTRIRIVALVDPRAHRQALDFINAGANEVFTRPMVPSLIIRALTSSSTGRLVHGDIEMDVAARRVWRGTQRIDLTTIEFAILQQFLLNPERVFARREIIARSWPSGIHVEPRTVNVHIARLRKHLTADGRDDPIRSVRGIGYGLDVVSKAREWR